MTAVGRTLLIVGVLVGVPIGALVVARTETQTPLPVTAATRQHYFQVGERQCEQAIRKAKSQQGAGQLLAIQIAIDTSGYPKEFREAVSAGCKAAPR